MFQMSRFYSGLIILFHAMCFTTGMVLEHAGSSTKATAPTAPLSASNNTKTTTTIPFTNSDVMEISTTDLDQELFELPQLNQTSKEPQENETYKCHGHICIPKCCPKGFLKELYGGCVNIIKYDVEEWTPDTSIVDTSQLEIVYWMPTLPKEEKYKNYVCPMHEYFEFSLQNDGKVYVDEVNQYISPELYCMDKIYDEDVNKTTIAGFFCYEMVNKTVFEKSMDKVLLSALAVSSFFVLAILLLYLLSPEKKDLQSKCTISSCLSLFFGFLTIVVNSTDIITYFNTAKCITIAIAAQFFMLSFYFWLNVMCFEISRIMRGTMKLLTYKEMTKSENRYFCYCAYAWGGPLIISIITIIMQYLPNNISPEIEKYLIRPDIGNGRCWFKESGGSIYAYYYSIEIFLHVVNSGLMGHIIYLLYKEEVVCLCCRRNNVPIRLRIHNSKNYLTIFKQQLSIYIMYVFIWVLNSVSLVNPRSYFWRTIDIVVALQGFFLFIIVTKPKKYAMLRTAADTLSSLVKSVSVRLGSQNAMISPSSETSTTAHRESRL